ncbi:SPT3 Dosage dependent suppressor of Ty-induced promoter mutations-like protein [Friedmanniomyces endolithicus]|nr:SPT3 Dosage dependent suppressor of Ty-induced promoter mutations-like protein [Friedmanniomyces endolithicus]
MDPRDWEDPLFSNPSFDETMGGSSPYNSAFDNYTNFDSYTDDTGVALRNPSRSGPTTAGAQPQAQQQQQPAQSKPTGPSAESSSQDSASDTSSRRKRKVTESPESAQSAESGTQKEESMEAMKGNNPQHFDFMPTRPMHDLSLEPDSAMMHAPYDFGSAASSPARARDFHIAMPTTARAYVPTTMAQFQHSPVQTINPGMFQIGRDESPIANMPGNGMYNNSPNAVFSTPSSDGIETFSGNQLWNNGMSATGSWPNPVDFGAHYNSPAALGLTPSPRVNGAGPARGTVGPLGRSPLHIAPISTKSRVETQITVIMTLEKPPLGIENLHLPLHTIAKSKLLAKDDYDISKTLEVHTMLVCTSAMHNPQSRDKAMQRAAQQGMKDIQRRAELYRQRRSEATRGIKEENKNDGENADDEDMPCNGGEVRICKNCIERERKRAGRKKVKKEEEQQHWERYESERVVVFNSNEYLPLKPVDHASQETGAIDHAYTPPEGSLQAIGHMRIACYCRHQQEKAGFQVIFTLKDQQGNVVAQQVSDSILITDDHKTHPTSFDTAMSGETYTFNPAFASNGGLPSSQSMVNLQMQGLPTFPTSRSNPNLQGLEYGRQHYNPQSHIHQISQQVSNSGYASHATSATMTPTSLSRPGSPTSAGNTGPNKKRKSSTFHGRVPSGLVMTPRVDTSQPPSAGMTSALSVTSPLPFSPTGDGLAQHPYMTMPNQNGVPQFFGSGPPTPSENPQGHFTPAHLAHLDQAISRTQNAQAYFSHPSSAVPSRSSSPVLQQSRPNMAAYARHPIQTPTNTMQARQAPYQQQHQQHHSQHQHPQYQQQQQQQAMNQASSGEPEPVSTPAITEMTTTEGPVNGGTKVGIFGYNFVNGMTVMFGDKIASATFYGPQALCATAPPSRPGGVNVTLVPPQPPGQGPQQLQQGNQYMQNSAERRIFTYKDPRAFMEMMVARAAGGQPMQQQSQQLGGAEQGGFGAAFYAAEHMAGQWTGASAGGGQRGQGY